MHLLHLAILIVITVAYMRDHEESKDILPTYVAIFEDQKYRTYEIPDDLNNILRLYQIYFRDTFYCGSPEAEAADKLRTGLKALLNTPDAGEGRSMTTCACTRLESY